MQKPHIMIIATGGTIAGKAASATNVTDYEAGALAIENLLISVPQLTEIARITGEQIASIGSQDMTTDIWLRLSLRINELLAHDDVDGIVITHGTDTLEETAYFLELTVKSSKPVVLVGAMRPATSLSADGPMNLLNAVRAAAETSSHGKGVLVVMNDTIDSAREVTKTRSDNVAAFGSLAYGALGLIAGGKVMYLRAPVRRHTFRSEFSVDGMTQLPRVDIVYSHAGADGVMVNAAAEAGAAGIIHAGTGNGSIHKDTEPALEKAQQRGIIIVRSSRIAGANTVPSLKRWSDKNFLDAGTLNPQKARILLMLALSRTKDLREIQRMFDEY